MHITTVFDAKGQYLDSFKAGRQSPAAAHWLRKTLPGASIGATVNSIGEQDVDGAAIGTIVNELGQQFIDRGQRW
jgi:autotransporter passenger strand-loop-strand repeat protein